MAKIPKGIFLKTYFQGEGRGNPEEKAKSHTDPETPETK